MSPSIERRLSSGVAPHFATVGDSSNSSLSIRGPPTRIKHQNQSEYPATCAFSCQTCFAEPFFKDRENNLCHGSSIPKSQHSSKRIARRRKRASHRGAML